MSDERRAHLEVRELHVGSMLRREARVQIDGQRSPVTWRYDITGGESDRNILLDGYLHSALFYLLKLGLPVRVHGALSADALYNLDELTRAWSQWRPALYRRFEIEPEQVVDRHQSPSARAIAAYSGGVDANFTLARNARREGVGGHQIGAVLMVHGFDVDFQDDDAFARLVARVRPVLEEFQVELKTIKTDSKLLDQDWEDSFGAQIAGCLHQFSGHYGRGLIASSEPYVALVTPLGSSPLTDRLFSGSAMSIVHDGAQFTRTAKLELLREHPTIVRHLKVCWEGRRQYENCGTCEKCVRTRLNFLAVGVPEPACFSQPFELDQLRGLRVGNAFQLGELRTLLQYAEERQLAADWVDRLRARIRRLAARRRVFDTVRRADDSIMGGRLTALYRRSRR